MDEIDVKAIQFSSVEEAISGGGYKIYSPPKASWQCQLTPDHVYLVVEGNQPNAFHRFMQRICFGLKWSRIDD